MKRTRILSNFDNDSYIHSRTKINFQKAPCADPEGGGTGGFGPPSSEKSQNTGFLSNTGPDSLKNKASIQCWAIIDPPAKRHCNGVSLASRS